jgi:hypothetical protein
MDMKEYCVDLDVTFSSRLHVFAKDEESAKAQALKLMEDNPYYLGRNGTYVSTEVTDAWIEDED